MYIFSIFRRPTKIGLMELDDVFADRKAVNLFTDNGLPIGITPSRFHLLAVALQDEWFDHCEEGDTYYDFIKRHTSDCYDVEKMEWFFKFIYKQHVDGFDKWTYSHFMLWCKKVYYDYYKGLI